MGEKGDLVVVLWWSCVVVVDRWWTEKAVDTAPNCPSPGW